jgi:hypothetical protein
VIATVQRFTATFALASVVGLLVAGCGSSGPKETAACNSTAGAASGDALVGSYNTAKFHVASILAKDYKGWIAGQDASDGGPHKPLCTLERQAVADIVLRYASAHQTEFTAGSAAADGGRNAASYLKSQGVDCDNECGIKPSATDLKLQAAAGRSTSQQNDADTASSTTCLSAFSAASRLIRTVQANLKTGTGNGGATALTGDVSAFAQSLSPLTSSANPGERASLEQDQKALTGLEGEGATAVSLGFGVEPLKSAGKLIGQICNG